MKIPGFVRAADRPFSWLLRISPSEVLEELRPVAAEVRRTPALRRLAQALLLALAALVAVHMTLAVGAFRDAEPFESLWRDGAWRLDKDHSIPEHLEYALLLTAAAVMAVCWRRTGAPIYAIVAIANLYIFADGYLMVHEGLGEGMNLASSWRGELVYFACIGAALGALVIFALRNSPRPDRAAGALCLAALAGLAVCAVGADAATSIAKFNTDSNLLKQALALAEDGGEMLFIMLNALVSAAILRRTGAVPASSRARPEPAHRD